MRCVFPLALVAILPAAASGQQAAERGPLRSLLPVSVPAEEERNKGLALRFYEEAWNNDNYALADQFFAPDYIRHDASHPAQGPGTAPLQSKIARDVNRIMPDFRYISFDVVLADEDMVAVRWTARGTPVGFPGILRRLVGRSGQLEMTGVNMYRLRDGRVVEIWNNRDDLTMMREMGISRLFALGGFLAGVVLTALLFWILRRRHRGASNHSPI